MTTISLQELHAQGPFLRRLARALVRDEAEAEDLVQETWLVALGGLHGPREDEESRGWLARLLRNRARSARRAAARRRARELAAGRARARRARGDTAVAETVLGAVLALAEPYRGVVLRRYYQGMTPTEIAALDGTPLKTVEARLRRAREELRARLDERCGGRASWCVALAGLAGLERPARVASGALLAACAAGFAGVAVLGWKLSGLGGAGGVDAELVAPRDTAVLDRPVQTGGPAASDGLVAPEDAPLARVRPGSEPAPAAAAEASFPAPDPDPVARIEGRVVAGPGDEPWVAATAVGRSGLPTGEVFTAPCEPSGDFALEVPLARGRWPIERVRLTAVAHDARPEARLIAVAAGAVVRAELVLDDPGAVAAGVALDDDGRPLAGVTVRLRTEGREARFHAGPHTLLLTGQARAELDVVTDSQGRFHAQGLAPWRHRALVLPPEDEALPTAVLDPVDAGPMITLPRDDLVLRATLAEVVLQALDPGGQPLPGVTMVRAGSLDDYAGAVALAAQLGRLAGDPELCAWRLPDDGSVRILGERGSATRVTLFRAGYEPVTLQPVQAPAAGGGEVLTVRFQPAVNPPRVAVRVFAAGGPAPEGVHVRLTPNADPPSPFAFAVERTLPPGAAELVIADVAPGRYEVVVTPPADEEAWLPARTTLSVARAGESRVAVRLEQGAVLRVVSERDLPASAGLELVLMRRGAEPQAAGRRQTLRLAPRAAAGLAAGVPAPLAPAVPPGRWQARLELAGEPVWTGPLRVARDGSPDLRLGLPAAGAAAEPARSSRPAEDGR